jgi:hypothetical protein
MAHPGAGKYMKGINKGKSQYGKNGSSMPSSNDGWAKAGTDLGHDWKNKPKGGKAS